MEHVPSEVPNDQAELGYCTCAIAPVDSKTFDGIRQLFDMFKEAAAAVFRCCSRVVIDESTS